MFPSSANLQYELNKETKAYFPDSKLFCFETFDEAYKYIICDSSYKAAILKCTTLFKPTPIYLIYFGYNPWEFWSVPENERYASTIRADEGCVGVESLTPIEVVYEGDL